MLIIMFCQKKLNVKIFGINYTTSKYRYGYQFTYYAICILVWLNRGLVGVGKDPPDYLKGMFLGYCQNSNFHSFSS